MVRFYVKDSERKPDPAPVKVNAGLAIGVGTALWVIALLAFLVSAKQSEKAGLIATCLVGIVLGGIGFWHSRRR